MAIFLWIIGAALGLLLTALVIFLRKLWLELMPWLLPAGLAISGALLGYLVGQLLGAGGLILLTTAFGLTGGLGAAVLLVSAVGSSNVR